MALAALKQEIQPLTRQEKAELMHFLVDLLSQSQTGDSPETTELAAYFEPGATYPVFTPYDCEQAAAQLQTFLEQQRR